MFDIDLLEKFRDVDINDENDVDDDVKNAWYTFISEFCTCVSFHWANYVKRVDRKDNATFISRLTASDEALAMWIISVKYNEVKEHADYIKQHGDDAWKKSKKKRKSGTHDSKSKIGDFISYHKSIIEKRQNKRSNKLWESIFFNQHIHDTSDSETASPAKTPGSASKTNVNIGLTKDDVDELEE